MKKNLLILCFHGVTHSVKSDRIENFSRKHISKKIFERHIKYLIKQKCTFLSIDQVSNHITQRIPFKKRSVCITFDDGFKNNFLVAAPILKKFNIPAIFYICPKNIELQEMFWVDKIEACINKTRKKNLNLKLDKKTNFLIASIKQKIFCIKKIKTFCKEKNSKIKNLLIKELIYQTKIKPTTKLSKNYEIATWSLMKKTLKSKLFKIGGHSLEHDIFTKITKKELAYDIKETIGLIKKKMGFRIKYFSYPEGQKNHFNARVIKVLKKNKIISCPSAIPGKNSHLDNLFNLRRVMLGFNNIQMPKF